MIGLSRQSMRISVWCAVLMPFVFLVGSYGAGGPRARLAPRVSDFCVPYYVIVFRKIEMPTARSSNRSGRR